MNYTNTKLFVNKFKILSLAIYAAEQTDIFQYNMVSVDHIPLTVYSTVECSCKYRHQHGKTTGN